MSIDVQNYRKLGKKIQLKYRKKVKENAPQWVAPFEPYHPTQLEIVGSQRRFNVACLGRRSGKTKMGIRILGETALDGYPVAWFSPTYKMLNEVWREVRNTLSPQIKSVSAQEHRLALKGGGVIDMWSMENYDAIRGRKYKLVIIDEAAMVGNLEDAWTAAIRPTLTDLKGDAWFLSTPKGLNYFWRLFNLGQDPEVKDWNSWRFSTNCNPFIDPKEIAAARSMLPALIFDQEYLAEFVSDASSVFRRLDEAKTAVWQEAPLKDHEYVMGIDFAKHNDFTVLTVIDCTTKQQCYMDRFNEIDYVVQMARIRALAARFKPIIIIAERNSIGEPICEQLWREGYPLEQFVTTLRSKAEVVEALALAFEMGDLKILPDDILLNELRAFHMERLPSGAIRYSAPEGESFHDDCVLSLCFAWAAAKRFFPDEPSRRDDIRKKVEAWFPAGSTSDTMEIEVNELSKMLWLRELFAEDDKQVALADPDAHWFDRTSEFKN